MKELRIHCVLSLLLALIISGMVCTYAWLSSKWNSGNSVFDFSVGNVPAPEAILWLYSTDLEESDVQARGWVEHLLTGNEQDQYAFFMPKVKSEENNGVYTFDMKSLQLGTVDNLLTMNNDNVVYLRFGFDSEIHGNSVATLDLALSGDKFEIYDSNGSEVIDEALKSKLTELDSQTPFLQYQACVSSQELSPDDDEFQELPFLEGTPFGNGSDLYSNEVQSIEGKYYIYIKVMPNLSAFAPASELLNKYMPCIILFDTQILLTVH